MLKNKSLCTAKNLIRELNYFAHYFSRYLEQANHIRSLSYNYKHLPQNFSASVSSFFPTD